MVRIQIKMLIVLFLSGLIFQSCSKDEDLTNDLTEVVTSENGNFGNNNGNNGNNHDNGNNDDRGDTDLAEIDNDLIHDWTAMENHLSTASKLQGLRIRNEERARNINYELALNACLAKVLDHFLLNLPTELNSRISDFKNEKEEALIDDVSPQLIQESNEWGTYVANQVIRYSQTDQAAEEQILEPQPLSYEPPTGDVFWTYSADKERALIPY